MQKLKSVSRAFLGLAGLLVVACGQPVGDEASDPARADLIFSNAAVHTMNPGQPRADAVAIRDGRILAVGSTEAITAAFSGPVRDLEGRMLLPAFHDAHAHPISGGLQLLGCSLSGIRGELELLAAIRRCALADPDGDWLIGSGWELSVFPPDGNPDKRLLDDIDEDRPVLMRAADGHSSWANSAALARAGISADTPDPRNGIIERDADGEPSGTLREAAQALVEAVVPPLTQAQRLAAARAALRHANELGVTAFVDASVGPEELAVWEALEATDELTARIVASIRVRGMSDDVSDALADPATRGTTALVRTDAAKLFLDGVLEGETAALLEPYLGGGTASGTLNVPWEDLVATVIDLDARGIQIHMHAIGDAAVREGLDAIEAARAANGPNDNRHHICHLQLVHPDDYPRFAALGVRANFQALWAYPDPYITDVNLPAVGQARVDRMYPIASIERAGGIIVGGSDWPVSSLDPLQAIETAVTRRDPDGVIAGALNTDESVSLDTMLAAYTRTAAELMHQEQESGTIEPGKAADLVVLDRDLHEIPADEIGDVKVLTTLFRGEVVYTADSGTP
ncbi:MAG: amidohydrolase [Pseudomonadales bacterium]|jgi:predicted amidohydrolase YtcJ|nr:amidohydrolase [Pseudomonadales bacterium]